MADGNGILARIDNNTREISRLRGQVETVMLSDAQRAEQVNALRSDFARLERALSNNTRATWALLAGLVGVALTIATTVLIAVS